MREKLLISACLLGEPCRYDGVGKPLPAKMLARLAVRYELLPVCPEQLGGLATPRPPAERRGERVVTRDGGDVTAAYAAGAAATLRLARENGCRLAVLKERSPSCGLGEIHNGRFDGGLAAGSGMTAELLEANGVRIVGESGLAELLK